jgi:hypothetical protein
MSKNTMSMVFTELRLILAFFGRGDDGLFHCDDFISRTYPWLVVPPFCPLCNRRLPHTRDHKITNITTDVSCHSALSRLKVTTPASSTLYCHLLARYLYTTCATQTMCFGLPTKQPQDLLLY